MGFQDEFMAGGSPSAKFNEVGDEVAGTICGPMDRKQQTDMKDKSLRTFPDGSPMWVYLLPLATTERNDEDDDGKRTLWINGEMRKAIIDAVRKSGKKEPAEGGYLKVKCTGLRPTDYTTKQKLFSAEYTPPAHNSFMADQSEPVAEAAAVQQAPPAQEAPPPTALDNDALKAALAAMTAEQRKAAGLA